MTIERETPSTEAVQLARQLIYRFLSLATSDTRSQRWLQLSDSELAIAANSGAEVLRDEVKCDSLAPGEIAPQALDPAELCRILRDPTVDVNSQYERVFGLMMSKKCPPYETEYCPQTF